MKNTVFNFQTDGGRKGEAVAGLIPSSQSCGARQASRPCAHGRCVCDRVEARKLLRLVGKTAPEPPDGVKNYYKDGRVCDRIYEFLGGSYAGNVTSKFLAVGGAGGRRILPVDDLPGCLSEGSEILRSLWDRESLIAYLDIHYVNFDFPGEVYLRPDRAFELLSPVENVTLRLLRDLGVIPLHVLSGQGHHFLWQVAQDSPQFESLREIGEGAPSALQIAAGHRTKDGQELPREMVEAYAGLGLVMEYLACEIKRRSAPLCALPVDVATVEVGPLRHGREMISVDISGYGEPLSHRIIRVPFSVYQYSISPKEAGGEAQNARPIFLVPLQNLKENFTLRNNAELMKEWAGGTSTRIPDQELGMGNLVKEYMASALRIVHEWFYSHRQHTPEEWPATYDRLSLDFLPSCARETILHPEDLLERPFGLRLITRVFLALGWHPRHIAGLIRSRIERDHSDGDRWAGRDPAMFADFYTRIFTGFFSAWGDDLVDLNCQSFKEETTCPNPACRSNLAWFRDSALSRRRHGQLGHKPFNELFHATERLSASEGDNAKKRLGKANLREAGDCGPCEY